MLKAVREQTEFLSLLDSILLALEMNDDIDFEKLFGNINVSLNPFDYLLKIIGKFIGKDEMIKWLGYFLASTLPVIELGVKGVLLSNLKKITSCNIDPWIPSHLRKEVGLYAYNNKSNKGLLINPASIDNKQIFRYAPMSKEGQLFYHGVQLYYVVEGDKDEERYYDYQLAYEKARKVWKGEDVILDTKVIKYSTIHTVHDLARAKDFNAFLWYIMRQCNFSKLKALDLEKEKVQHNLGVIESNYGVQGQLYYGRLNNAFHTTMLSLALNSAQTIGVGNDTTVSVTSTIVPFSNTSNSANWYVNPDNFYDYLTPKKWRPDRDYNKEYGICNLSFEEDEVSMVVVKNRVDPLYPSGNLRFTILPAPAIHRPYMANTPIGIIKILFNKDGKPDKKGRFSINIDTQSPKYCKSYGRINTQTTNIILDDVKGVAYEVKAIDSNKSIGYLWVNTDNGAYEFKKFGGYEYDIIYKALYECYPGLTVYDFNFDFVRGIQLFDPKVVASQLISVALGLNAGLDLNLKTNKTETAYQMRISEIIKNIVEQDAYEASDCFFNFSNEQYDKLLNDAELKRASGYAFENDTSKFAHVSMEEVNNILNEFNENGTLEENVDVFTRAFNQISATISKEALPEDKYNVELGVVFNLIKSLVMTIVDALLSPKVILLIQVNTYLMNGQNQIFKMEDLLKMIDTFIVSIVIELRDMILQYLIDWVLQLLQELIQKLGVALLKEQLRFYQRLLQQLLEACKLSFPLFGHRKLLDSQLDMVNYADIDEVEKPVDGNC